MTEPRPGNDTSVDRIEDLPTRYMQRRAPALNAAYRDPSSPWDADSKSYVISNELELIWTFSSSDGRELAKLASDETEKFKQIMDEFCRQRSKPTKLTKPTIPSVNIRDKHTWADVLAQVTLAKEEYGSQVKGKKGIPRRAVRFIADHAEVVDPYLKLVPDTDYSSVICGGLKFVFGAAATYKKVREDVLDALETLPDEIEEVGDCLQRFSEALDAKTLGQLRDKALRLYVAILAVIEGILVWLDENAFKKLAKALMLQKSYGKNVKAMIEELKSRSSDLKQMAATCGQTVGVKSLSVIKEARTLAEQNLAVSSKNYMLGSIQNERGAMILDRVEDSHKAISALAAQVNTRAILEDDQKAQIGDLKSALEQALWREKRLLELRSYWRSSHSPGISLLDPPQSPHLNRQQVQAILRVDIPALGSVIDTILSNGLHRQLSSTALTRSILQVPKFRDWLQRDCSGAIMLRTVEAVSPSQRITRLTQFSAALLTSLEDISLAFISHYFFGVMSLGEQEGRYHVLRCLTAELLERWPADKMFPVAMDFSKLMSHDFQSLWNLFLTVLKTQPCATVFCVLDCSVRCLEESELILTVRGLQWLQDNQGVLGDVKLKLLLTWPAPSDVVELFREEDQVLLPIGISDAHGVGHNVLQRSLLEGVTGGKDEDN